MAAGRWGLPIPPWLRQQEEISPRDVGAGTSGTRHFILAWALMVAAAAIAASSAWAAEESVLAKVKRTGSLKVCIAQGLPEVYRHPTTAEWNGVFIDLVHELTRWMNVKPEFLEVAWDIAVLSLNRGDCDLFGGSLVYNAPRAMQIDYIRPFWAKGINVVIRKENPKKLKRPEDLNSDKLTLAVVVGTREHETAKRLFPNAKLLALKSTSIQLPESVKRGDADAALLPTVTIKWWLTVSGNRAWGILAFPGSDFGNAPNGWAIRYGDRDWKDFLDAFSDWVAANKVAVNLYEDYIQKTGPFATK